MIIRFSTMTGERRTVNAEHDARGFAVESYTEESNRYIVGIASRKSQ